MAAPDSTQWGAIYGGKGRLGIYVNVANTNTNTTVNVQVWFWTKYGCTDSGNTFYYDAGYGTSSATTSMGNVTIRHTVSSGDGWSTSNQTKLAEYTYNYDRQTWSVPYNIYTKLAGIDYVGTVLYANSSYTVPALTSYTVAYDANGGTGAPSSQTKWYGRSLSLSNTKPSKTGHSFSNWLSSAQNKSYAPGALYEYEASTTMAAQWTANTYTVLYDANGGTGAPSLQTKTYGVSLTLSDVVPTRTNYNFLGWAASASATTAIYTAGGSYTSNASITLYAVWELAYSPPTVSNLIVERSLEDGTPDDYGTYAKISFLWSCDQNIGENTISSITIKHKKSSDTTWSETSVSATGISGSVTKVIGNGAISEDYTYDVELNVADSLNGVTTLSRSITGAIFPMDFLSGGHGVSFGKPASLENTAEFEFNVKFNGLTEFKGKTLLDSVYPVGSIYISYNDTSPASLFGGEWYRIESRFLYGCTSNETPGLTGGSQDHQHDWSLVFAPYYGGLIGEDNAICAVKYDADGNITLETSSWHSTASMSRNSGLNAGATDTTATRRQVTGTTKVESNMPPYINVAIWRRTA